MERSALVGRHIRLPALRDFAWPDQQADAMAGGLAAIAAYLAPHRRRAVNLHGGEDAYYLGAVRQAALRPALL